MALATRVSVPVWVYLGAYGAENTDWLMQKIHQFQYGLFVLIGIGAAVLGYFWWKKRQRLRFYREHLRELRAQRKAKKAVRKAAEKSAANK